MNIIQTPSKNFSEREGYKPELIVVHISAGSLTSMDSWFNTPSSQASAHYGVSKDGVTIHQYVQEDKKAWHAGRVNNPSFKLYKPGINPNLYTIGIENEGLDLANAPEVQLKALCELIRDIGTRFNIKLDRDHVIGHYQIDAINRNFCPSGDHTVLDRLVNRLNNDELVNIQVPKSKLAKITDFLLKI